MADLTVLADLTSDDQKAAMAYMSQHFVAMLCDYESYNDDGSVFHRGTASYSGFLLELHGIGFWVTAGHCLKDELDGPIEKGQLKVTGGRFLDHFGHESKYEGGIPFTYEPSLAFPVDDQELALDFALIQLDSNQVRLLKANKLNFISRNNWVAQPRFTFKSYKMLGLVGQSTITPGKSLATVETHQAMISVEKISLGQLDEMPSEYEESLPSEDWFVGKIPKNTEIESIRGMSGGPIYGFRYDDDGNLRYHVVALQSRWWLKSHAIFGCPLTLFGEHCYQWVGDYIRELADGPKSEDEDG